jgi:hypothetical protein
MPWPSLNNMSTDDLRNVYQFIKSLGPKGQHAPDRLEPDETPTTPYIVMVPQMPPPQK